MGIIKDLTGQRFGYLRVIELAPKKVLTRKNRSSVWKCLCDCGEFIYVTSNDLKTGNTSSCTKCGNKRKGEVRKKENIYDLTGEYGIGTATNNPDIKFYFDLDDYAKIKDYAWGFNDKTGYLQAGLKNSTSKIYIHRLIMEPIPNEMVVDHINGNRLDNRKNNLRCVTTMQNTWNRTETKNIYTNQGYKKPYLIQFVKNNIYYRYTADTLEEAITIRDQKRREIYGEFARQTTIQN